MTSQSPHDPKSQKQSADAPSLPICACTCQRDPNDLRDVSRRIVASMDQMLAATAAAEDHHYWFRGLRRTAHRWLTEASGDRPMTRIVDCGAGTGRNLDWLRALGPAVGIELTPLALEVGRRRGRSLVRGTVTSLPLADRSVTLATSFDVLYCLPDVEERQAVAEMWRVLEPGGMVLVNVAALDILRGSHSTLTHEVRRYTTRRLADLLAGAGFIVDRVSYINLSLFPPALAVRSWQRLTGSAQEPSANDLAVPPRAVNALVDRVLAAEAALLRVTNLPIGTSVMALAHKPAR
jgi:ubiquinone/menaquinone biosynthesis C-methylase UbiE